MKYKEFLEICKEINSDFPGQGSFELTYDGGYEDGNNWRERKKVTDNPRLYVQWSTGGKEGGNCWNNDEPQHYTSDNSPEDLQILDSVLEKICPTITFLQYKNLYNTVTKHDTYTESEYYGNSRGYSTKTILVKELF